MFDVSQRCTFLEQEGTEIISWLGKYQSTQSYVHRAPLWCSIRFSIWMQMAHSRDGHWTVETSTKMMVKQMKSLQYRGNEAMSSTSVNKTWNLSLKSRGTSFYSLENQIQTWSWLDMWHCLLPLLTPKFSLSTIIVEEEVSFTGCCCVSLLFVGLNCDGIIASILSK